MGTKRDIPAINTLTGLSREWSEIGRPPPSSTFDEIRQHRSCMSTVTARTHDGVTKVQEYVDEVGKEVSAIKAQVKSSLIDNVQTMAGLVNKLVPTNKKDPVESYGGSSNTGYQSSQHYRSSNGGHLPRKQDSMSYKRNLAKPKDKGHDNEMIARHMKEEAENLKQMQNLESFLGKMEHLCEKIRSEEGIDSEEIKSLQDDLNGYGDTLENEQERQQREEKQKRERERAEEEEKRRIEEEKRRRNPANWKPVVLKDKSDRERIDVLCVVYVIDGCGCFYPTSLHCTNVEGQTMVADWLSMPYDQQASSPILISYNGYNALDLQERLHHFCTKL